VGDRVHEVGGRRAWFIWSVAIAVYVLAVCNRSSLGVAGLLATDRFTINGTQLAAFTVLQLLVYAGLQVPVGVLLDRYGSRALLLAGLALMTAGQLAFAFSTSFPAGLLARGVLGAGDAMIFISVMRIVAVWFLVRQAPVVVQLTGQLGQLGGVLAAAPLAWVLHELGWTRAFAGLSVIGVVLLVATVLLVEDSPYPTARPVRAKTETLLRSLATVWGNPGTRLGLWSHFTSQFSVTVFTLLWGYPFLVRGQGLSTALAAVLLMLPTCVVLIVGVPIGRLVGRVPYYRSYLVLTVVAAIALTWSSVLVWPGRAPLWLLVVLVCVMAVGGPASMVGFDLARTFTPVASIGRANGVVNVGGFVASLLTMGLIGVILDIREPAGAAAYGLDDFKVALAAQYLFWLLGAVQILRYRRRAIAHLHRVHPGAVEQLRQGRTFVHPGVGPQEGV
jgi:MFS family permease